jgi:hypothetical protein
MIVSILVQNLLARWHHLLNILRHITGMVAAMTESELVMPSEKISYHALG